MDHNHHDMPARCSMNMLWNTQIIDTCIVFRSWHITSNIAFIFSFFIIVGFGIFYEWLRQAQVKLDRNIAAQLAARSKLPSVVSDERDSPTEEDSLIGRLPKARKGVPLPFISRIKRAGLYGVTVFLSFFIMLIFMTYNAYLIAAVTLGAATGHYIFGANMDVEAVLNGVDGVGKGMCCH